MDHDLTGQYISGFCSYFLKNQSEKLKYESSSLVISLACMSEIALLEPSVFERYHTTVIRDFTVKELLMKDRVCLDFIASFTDKPIQWRTLELGRTLVGKVLGVVCIPSALRSPGRFPILNSAVKFVRTHF